MVYLVVSLVFLQSVSAGSPSASDQFGELSYGENLVVVPGMNELHQSVGLTYTGGAGIKTYSPSSWVGLGWGLDVGSISRLVSGVPDDYAFEEDKTVYVNNIDVSNTADQRSWWEKWGDVFIMIIVVIVVIVVAILTGGLSLTGSAGVLTSAAGATAFAAMLPYVAFALTIALTITVAALEGGWEGVMKLKLGKDVLFPALKNLIISLVTAGLGEYANLVSTAYYDGAKAAAELAATAYASKMAYDAIKTYEVVIALVKLGAKLNYYKTILTFGVGMVSSIDPISGYVRGFPAYQVGGDWKSINNPNTAAGDFIESPFGYITFDEYFSEPTKLSNDGVNSVRDQWFSFFDTANPDAVFIPRSALYGVSDIKSKVFQFPKIQFGMSDIGKQDSWSISGGPGGNMYYEPFKGFRILSNQFHNPKIEYFRGTSGLIEMFVVTDLGGSRFVYGSLDEDALDKTWTYISGSHTYTHISYEADGFVTDNINRHSEFTVKPYVTSWKLTAILGPEYRGKLNPLEDSLVKHGGSQRSLGNPGTSGSVVISDNGDYLCGDSSSNCEVVHDTSKGSWISFTYDRIIEHESGLAGNCGYNFGPLEGENMPTMEADCSGDNGIKDGGGNCWTIEADESYFGGFNSVEYIHKIFTPFGEAEFSTSPRLDSLESAPWGDDTSSAPKGMLSRTSSNEYEDYVYYGSDSSDGSSSNSHSWKTPWSFDFSTKQFKCRNSGGGCSGSAVDDSGYIAGDAFTCEAGAVDYQHKLDDIELFIYDDYSKRERIRKVYFNKDVSVNNQYSLKKLSRNGAPAYGYGVYTLNNVVTCGKTDGVCDTISFEYND